MLEQATFGPTPELVNQMQQFDAFLQDQFSAPASTYPGIFPNLANFTTQDLGFLG
jgi:hypothetical protein